MKRLLILLPVMGMMTMMADGPFFPPDPYCPPECWNDPQPLPNPPGAPPVPSGCGYTPTRCS